MSSLATRHELATWSVTVSPTVLGDARWRAQLIEKVRAGLERRLCENPGQPEFVWTDALLSIRVHRVSGAGRPGTEIRLVFREEPSEAGRATAGTGKVPALPSLVLPDEHLGRLAERLVGTDAVRDEVLLQLGCRWDGVLDRWSAETKAEVSPALRQQLEESIPLFLFHGDPGVGKSVCAQVVADRYCRETRRSGRLFSLTTDARGSGLVGDFSGRIRAGFEAACRAAEDGPAFLLIDEADALAMRRSESHAHQEDRAATATLLQVLDALRGGPPVAVFLTTNLLETVDSAVRRRGAAYAFARPGPEARRAFFRQWFPEADKKLLDRASRTSEGMTPADIERALRQVGMQAIREGVPLTPQMALKQLKSGERTGRV